MEYGKSPLQDRRFSVIANDDEVFELALADYNKRYGIKLEVVRFIYDEVVFAELSGTCRDEDIFGFGYFFATYAQMLRDRGELDW